MNFELWVFAHNLYNLKMKSLIWTIVIDTLFAAPQTPNIELMENLVSWKRGNYI